MSDGEDEPHVNVEHRTGVCLIAAAREATRWHLSVLPTQLADDLDAIIATLRDLQHESFVFVIVDEDFFVVVRVTGQDARYLLSDVTAATDWPIAQRILDRLRLPLPDDDEAVQPAGDLTIFTDFGVGPMELAAICDDIDSYPDEMISDLAERMGFGGELEAILDDAGSPC